LAVDHAAPIGRARKGSAASGAGLSPRIAYSSDDMVVIQSLVASGMGVATASRTALKARRAPGIHTTELADNARQICAVTYSDPQDPPATTALIEILKAMA
jgi:DNA-binding transcriptional LysR family regulator